MFSCRASIALMTALVSGGAGAAVGPGDHLFLYARILDCDDAVHLVDHAQVTESGDAVFSNGVRLKVSGSEPQEIAGALADRIAAQTGRLPRTIRIEVVPDADSQRVVRKLQTVLQEQATGCVSRPDERCPEGPDPHEKLPAEGFNRRIA